MRQQKPLMFYTLMAAQGREEDTIKYSQMCDLILSINLAAAVNRRGRPNKAVRECARIVEQRITHPQVKAIIKNLCNPVWTPDPVSFSTSLMRSAREAEATIRRRMIADGIISILD